MLVKLVRHGETDWNLENRIQGQKQLGLNKRGIEQSEKVAEILKLTRIDEIYSSDLKRSFQTAVIINKNFRLPIIQFPELREISYGYWEGKLWSDIYKANPYLCNSWENLGLKFCAPGGESALEFRNRVVNAFRNIIFGSTAKDILIVTHGQVIKMILTCFREVGESEVFTFINVKHSCIETIEAEEIEIFKRNSIRLLNTINL